MKKLQIKRSGFTLIELILVITLTLLLTSSAISGLIRSEKAFTFNSAEQQIASMVREARSLAVTGKSVLDYTDYDNDTLDDSNGDTVTPAHYGIHFDAGAKKLILFADLHDSGTEGVYDAPDPLFIKYVAGKDLRLMEYDVPASLDLKISAGGTGANTVMYSPIFADTAFSQGAISKDLTGEFFIFGIKETDSTPRESCFSIHPIAGVAESASKSGQSCP